MKAFGFVAGLLALGLVPCAHGAGFVESYSVNAQYRGGVKKGFQDLGAGKVSYEALAGADFRVHARARIRHPEDGREYAFDLSEHYRLAGNSIASLAVERRELNEHARPHAARVTEVLPFAYLVRVLPAPAGGGDPSRTLTFRGRGYTLRWRPTERHFEVDLYRENEFIGKFFLLRERIGRIVQLDKFRVAIPEEKLVISFIVTEHVPRP